jgi:hypothetical protein
MTYRKKCPFLLYSRKGYLQKLNTMKNISAILISLALIGCTKTAFNQISAQLPSPSGYKSDMIIFEDQFLGTTLDNTKWIPQVADRSGI